MELADISNLRLISQRVKQKEGSENLNIEAIVEHMGAIQAQDYEMAKWAIGVRCPESKAREVEKAMEKGSIIRTHVLRPTWHLVSPHDLPWMLKLSAPRIKALSKPRHRQLGLSDDIFRKSNALIEKSLGKGKHMTRDEIVGELKKANIPTSENRSSHLLIEAELSGIICSGIPRDGKQTYALFEERIPGSRPLKKDEAMTRLALKYFSSHYPATIYDFSWWSGLNITDSRRAIEMVRRDLIEERVDSHTYWLPNDFSGEAQKNTDAVYLLPAFDEFIISYKDRSPSLSSEDHKKAVSINGLFRPLIVKGGRVIGIWKRTAKKNAFEIELDLFQTQSRKTLNAIEERLLSFGAFWEKNIVVTKN